MGITLYQIFKKIYTIASYCGFTPLLNTKRCSIVKILYLFYLAVEIADISKPIIYPTSGTSELMLFLEYCHIIAETISTAYYIFIATFKTDVWKKILRNIETISKHGTVTENTGIRSKMALKLLLIILTITILHLVISASGFYAVFFTHYTPSGFAGGITRIVNTNYVFMLIMSIVAIHIVSEKFVVLKNQLKSQIEGIMRNGISSETMIKDIFKQITDVHAGYYSVVADLNSIFKLPVYLYLVRLIVFTIHRVLLSMLLQKEYGDLMRNVQNMFYVCMITDMVCPIENISSQNLVRFAVKLTHVK
ncbi:hypothetical protein JTB14_037851 [Gonioctena quinquepunctata]|nr:hypothetical protein JTB14_037851 [Gonioctena quinquepunctata]